MCPPERTRQSEVNERKCEEGIAAAEAPKTQGGMSTFRIMEIFHFLGDRGQVLHVLHERLWWLPSEDRRSWLPRIGAAGRSPRGMRPCSPVRALLQESRVPSLGGFCSRVLCIASLHQGSSAVQIVFVLEEGREML